MVASRYNPLSNLGTHSKSHYQTKRRSIQAIGARCTLKSVVNRNTLLRVRIRGTRRRARIMETLVAKQSSREPTGRGANCGENGQGAVDDPMRDQPATGVSLALSVQAGKHAALTIQTHWPSSYGFRPVYTARGSRNPVALRRRLVSIGMVWPTHLSTVP